MKFYITKVNLTKLPSDLGVAYSADVSVNNWVLINDIHYWFEGTQLVLKFPSNAVTGEPIVTCGMRLQDLIWKAVLSAHTKMVSEKRNTFTDIMTSPLHPLPVNVDELEWQEDTSAKFTMDFGGGAITVKGCRWDEGRVTVPSTVNLTKLCPWRVIGQLGQAFAQACATITAQVENW